MGRRPLDRESDSDDDVLFTSGGPPPIPPQPQETPPPSYNTPQAQAATLIPTPFTEHPSISQPPFPFPQATPVPVPVPINESPPDYFLHAPKEAPLGAKAGLAVQIQIDGKLVPGTVMEDVRY